MSYTSTELRNWDSGYAIEKEDRREILRACVKMPYTSDDVALPDDVDPRFDPKFNDGWLRTENQYMGACQGYSLTENGEYCYAVHTGRVIQLCPIVAYVISQKFDGISGDRGSTLSGGTKAARDFGFVEHGKGLSERSYPSGGHRAVTPEMATLASRIKLQSSVDIRQWKIAKAFVGSFVGLGQFGTKWTQGLANPTSNGVIKSISGSNYGGHAYTLAGYRKIDTLDAAIRRDLPTTKYEEVVLGKNSHSTRYGEKGWFYMIVEHYEQLARDNWTVVVGRSDLKTPEPRESKIDFTKKNRFG